MKESKARKPECCRVDFALTEEAMAFDTLLTRVLGAKAFCVKKTKNPKGFEFIFWATPREQQLIDDLWDSVLAQKWNEEEFEELVASN